MSNDSLALRSGRHKRLRGPCSRRHGFTLIELLVVVAIIVVLIAILLPSLSRAKERAKTVVCASHLRQLGMLEMMYAQDFNGVIPSYYYNSTTRLEFVWYQWLNAGYIPSRGYDNTPGTNLILCPSGNPNKFNPDSANISGTRYRTYAMRRDVLTDYDVRGASASYNSVFYRFTGLDSASTFPLISDSDATTWNAQYYCFSRTFLWENIGGVTLRRHQNKPNMLFGDMHVESCGAADLVRMNFTKWVSP